MRRDLRILLGTVGLGSALLLAEHGREWLAALGTFQVRDIQVSGATFVPREDVVQLMALEPGASIWDETEVWAERVARHPLIRSVQVARRFPGGLRVVVSERQPVALAPTPVLEPVDADGYRLPVDPSRHRLDLPVLATHRMPAEGARLVPGEVRSLAQEIGRLMSADTAFLQRVSELGWQEDGTLRVRWTQPPVDFLLPAGTPPGRLREGLAALADAMGTRPTAPPDEIDLRFADQVVVRRTRD